MISRAAANTPCKVLAVVERRRVVGHHGHLAVTRTRGELVVGDLPSPSTRLIGLGARRVGEVVLERRADQLVARAPGERLHLLVDVGDDAPRVGRHQRVDVGLDQRARVEVLVAQTLVELMRSASTCLRAVLSVPISR